MAINISDVARRFPDLNGPSLAAYVILKTPENPLPVWRTSRDRIVIQLGRLWNAEEMDEASRAMDAVALDDVFDAFANVVGAATVTLYHLSDSVVQRGLTEFIRQMQSKGTSPTLLHGTLLDLLTQPLSVRMGTNDQLTAAFAKRVSKHRATLPRDLPALISVLSNYVKVE